MRKVRRWSVPPSGSFVLAMPAGAELLAAAPQAADNVVLWALIDDKAPKVPRQFLLTVTGSSIDTSLPLEHVSSFQTTTDPVVEFHLFEVKGKPVAIAPSSLRATSAN